MDTKTIYAPEYMQSLHTQIGTTKESIHTALQDLKKLHEARGGQWEDSTVGNGPAQTFGELVGQFEALTNEFTSNLETTASNVTNYGSAMDEVATTFNFAASS